MFKGIFNAFESALNVDLGHPKDPVLARWFGTGQSTNAGVQVNYEKTMALPAIFRGANIIGNAMARVPFQIVEYKDGDENGTPAKGHTSWYSVTSKPHSEIKMVDFRKTMTVWALLWGNAVAYIDRPGWPNGGEVNCIPLLPDRTRMVRIDAKLAKKYSIPDQMGNLYYETVINGEHVAYSADNCLHIKGLGGNPYWGYDIVDLLKEAIGGASARMEFGHRFYGQGANPAGFIEMPEGLEEEAEERFIQSVRAGMEGMGKSHRMMLLEQGAKFTQWTVDPAKAQFLEGLELDYRILANIIGIKVHKLIDTANSSYNSLESANAEHRDDDLTPWMVQWKSEMHDKMLTINQKKYGTHEVVVDDEYLDGWVPYYDKVRGVVEAKNNDLITRDEGRSKLNYGPSKDGHGDKHTIPMNVEFTKDKLAMAQIEKKIALEPPAPPAAPAAPPEKEKEDDGKDEKKEPKEDKKTEALTLALNNELHELRTAWLNKIQIRLTKQADKQAEKSREAFATWVSKLSTESAPASLQEAVDDYYQALKEELTAIAEKASDENFLAEVGSAHFLWRPNDEE